MRLEQTPDHDITNTTPKSIGSASRRKLLSSENSYGDYSHNVNIIVTLELLNNAISDFAVCKQCKDNSIKCVEDCKKRAGLATNLVLMCTNCSAEHSFSTSPVHNSVHDVNMRLVYGLRCIGKGFAARRTLCAVLNLPKPPTQFRKYYRDINNAIQICAL